MGLSQLDRHGVEKGIPRNHFHKEPSVRRPHSAQMARQFQLVARIHFVQPMGPPILQVPPLP